eukprot:scaffold122522_cov75-Phaeocystis_antarctica.AAC.1
MRAVELTRLLEWLTKRGQPAALSSSAHLRTRAERQRRRSSAPEPRGLFRRGLRAALNKRRGFWSGHFERALSQGTLTVLRRLAIAGLTQRRKVLTSGEPGLVGAVGLCGTHETAGVPAEILTGRQGPCGERTPPSAACGLADLDVTAKARGGWRAEERGRDGHRSAGEKAHGTAASRSPQAQALLRMGMPRVRHPWTPHELPGRRAQV